MMGNRSTDDDDRLLVDTRSITLVVDATVVVVDALFVMRRCCYSQLANANALPLLAISPLVDHFL